MCQAPFLALYIGSLTETLQQPYDNGKQNTWIFVPSCHLLADDFAPII